MTANNLAIVCVGGDRATVAVFARRFPCMGWRFAAVPSLEEAERVAVTFRPCMLLVHASVVDDVRGMIARVRALPTMCRTVIVFFADQASHEAIAEAHTHGAASYLTTRHTSPEEAFVHLEHILDRDMMRVV